MLQFRLTIGGQSVATHATVDVLNPANETVVAASPQGTLDHLEAAVIAARRALPGWSALPDAERATKLNEIANIIEAHHSELSQLITLEQGKTQSGPGANMEAGGCVA